MSVCLFFFFFEFPFSNFLFLPVALVDCRGIVVIVSGRRNPTQELSLFESLSLSLQVSLSVSHSRVLNLRPINLPIRVRLSGLPTWTPTSVFSTGTNKSQVSLPESSPVQSSLHELGVIASPPPPPLGRSSSSCSSLSSPFGPVFPWNPPSPSHSRVSVSVSHSPPDQRWSDVSSTRNACREHVAQSLSPDALCNLAIGSWRFGPLSGIAP